MTPGLWGGVTAVVWGGADFAARFTGRGIGYASALFAMLLTGSTLLTLWVWLAGASLVWTASGLWLLAVAGLTTMVATLLLYRGLTLGPVSIISPIVGGYPALVVAFAVVTGARPGPLQWVAMAATLVGVVIVARSTGHFERQAHMDRRALRQTVLLGLGSCLGFAVAVATAQEAVPIYGHLQTLWVSRLVSLLAIIVVLRAGGGTFVLPRRWWPLLGLQGLLDTGGYVTLFLGSYGAGAELAAVTASAFGAVTTVLARLFLREPMRRLQWLGIALVFGGVAVLSA